MKLTDEQSDKLVSWVEEKWLGEKECPICKVASWGISNTLFELKSYGAGVITVGGPLVPLAVVTCSNCGYSITFNALRIGILPDEPKVEPHKENK